MTAGDTTSGQTKAVDVVEAARRLGITPDAVRAKLRRRSLEGFRDNQGRWHVVLPDTIGGSRNTTSPVAAPAGDTTGHDAAVARQDSGSSEPDREAIIAELRARVASLEADKERLMTMLETVVRRPPPGPPPLLQSVRKIVSALADRIAGDTSGPTGP